MQGFVRVHNIIPVQWFISKFPLNSIDSSHRFEKCQSNYNQIHVLREKVLELQEQLEQYEQMKNKFNNLNDIIKDKEKM